MSNTQIELTTLEPPAAVAKSGGRRQSSIRTGRLSLDGRRSTEGSAEINIDGQSLERTETTTTITSKSRTTIVIISVTLITAISTLLNGLTTVALPTMAVELDIPKSLLLWPTSIQALTNGCSLLISGSLADALGARLMYLVGCVLQAGFILGCGLSRSSAQIILFRGLSGIAISFCLPSAVAIITKSFVGRRRNLAFASMGGGQPIGFAIGLALGGVLTDSIGWRWGFFLSAILDAILCGVAFWGLPSSIDSPADEEGPADLSWGTKWRQLRDDVDWVGAVVASTSLGCLSYVFASITGSTASIKNPSSIALLVIAVTLIPTFIYWVGRQERLGRPAIIPNSLWHNSAFTAISIAVFLTWGSFNALETFLTFFFQRVQLLTAVQASLRFLPAPISGALSNIVIGVIVHRVSAHWLVLGGCLISASAPLIMAFTHPHTSYWSSSFLANCFNPVGADSLFTIANLVITSVFPPKTQGLAGGVFNTVSQIGKSVGLALSAVIAASVTRESGYSDKDSPKALLKGYTATFWFCFGMVCTTVMVSGWGLRKVGKVGHKRD